MEVLGITIQEERLGKKGVKFSLELLGEKWERFIPGLVTERVIEAVKDRAKVIIRKIIVNKLYARDKKNEEGKYFVTNFAEMKDAVSQYGDKVIGSVFCSNLFKRSNISFWTDDDLVLKLKQDAE